MDAKAAYKYFQSIEWNVLTRHLGECLSKGVDVSHLAVPVEGWVRIGRYAAGKDSAYVQASKMRRRWPNVEIEVRGAEGEEWKAEIWARRKEEKTA